MHEPVFLGSVIIINIWNTLHNKLMLGAWVRSGAISPGEECARCSYISLTMVDHPDWDSFLLIFLSHVHNLVVNSLSLDKSLLILRSVYPSHHRTCSWLSRCEHSGHFHRAFTLLGSFLKLSLIFLLCCLNMLHFPYVCPFVRIRNGQQNLSSGGQGGTR